MDVINSLILQAATSSWLPLVLFAVAVIDGFFPPVPAETILVAAAASAAASGGLPTVVMLGLLAAGGAFLGDNLAYVIGRRLGVRRWSFLRNPRLDAAFSRAERELQHRGAPLILGARYVPVGRVAVNMSAGALGYRWRRFLALSAVACATWGLYGTLIGTVAGHSLNNQPLLNAGLGVLLAVVAGVAIDRASTLRRQGMVRGASAPSSVRGADLVEAHQVGS